MPLNEPRAVSDLPKITPTVKALTSELAHIDLSKFQFKFGVAAIAASVIVFFVGHYMPLAENFTKDFTDKSWYMTIALFAVGVAFCGKEVVQGFVTAMKSMPGK